MPRNLFAEPDKFHEQSWHDSRLEVHRDISIGSSQNFFTFPSPKSQPIFLPLSNPSTHFDPFQLSFKIV